MKSFGLIYFTIFLSMFFVSCRSEQKPEIHSGIDECHRCKMVITETNQACGFFQEGDFKTFCSPFCLIAAYDDSRKSKHIRDDQIYFADFESRQLIHADSTYFLFTNSFPTVMNSGILTFHSEQIGQQFLKRSDEFITDWRNYLLIASTPDIVVKVKLKENLLIPDILIVAKDDLVQLEIECYDQSDKSGINIKGYADEELYKVSEDKSILIVRFVASKPGSGFPITFNDQNEPAGMIKVHGAHTMDEEVM